MQINTSARSTGIEVTELSMSSYLRTNHVNQCYIIYLFVLLSYSVIFEYVEKPATFHYYRCVPWEKQKGFNAEPSYHISLNGMLF
jgi:hypothetical protein